MRTLIGYEIKKIVCKKSFLFSLVLLFGLQVFLASLGAFGNVSIVADEADGAPGENHSVILESFLERNRVDRGAGVGFTGTVFDEAFFAEIADAFAPYMNEEDETHRLTDAYRRDARRYEIVLERLKMYTGLYGSGYAASQQASESDFYARMDERRKKLWDEYFCLTEGERAHWEAVRSEQPKKLVYEYCYAYEEILGMQGFYFTHMLLVFFFSVTMTWVLLAEVNRNTDQMILCTKKGRSQLYAAKLIAAELVTLVTTALFSATLVIGRFLIFGPEGFSSRFADAMAPWYPGKLTMGGCALLFLLILFLSSFLITEIAMLLSFATRNGIVSVASLLGGLFAARLISIPGRFVFLGKLWHTLPINLLKWDEGFIDMRLFRVFGGYLKVWQAALLLYVLVIALLALFGRRLYCRTQVGGR